MTSPLSPDHLRGAFQAVDLDGREAQGRMAPRRRGPRPVGADDTPVRDAAALAYLFQRAGRLWLPLTLRSNELPEHRGQVSLPGGRPRDGEALDRTAHREAQEEIGLDGGVLETLGWLEPVYIPVTHSRLNVLVTYGRDPGVLRPDPREVSRVVLVELDELVDPARAKTGLRKIQGELVDVPYFDVGGLFLWGATAMALSELVERVRRVG